MSVRRFLLRLANAVGPGRGEADLAREMASHLALLEDDYRRRGFARDDARAAARRALGSMAHAGDLHRDARSFVWLDDLRWDTGYAARLLRRNPLFALTAALSLAIGIGANTTIFSVANALLFAKPIGVVEADRIVDIGGTLEGFGAFGQVSYPNYVDVRQRVTTLDAVYAYHPVPQPMSLGSSQGAERISGTYVTTNYFTVLGVRPAAGRLFGDGDSDRAGASPIVVLSFRLWMRRFSGDPALVGRPLTINGQLLTVVGVAAEGFRGTSILAPDAWLPVGMAEAALLSSREMPWPLVGGRLARGIPISRAAGEVDAIGRALEREYPDQNAGKGLRLVPATPIPGNIVPVAAFLSLLMAIVSLVLVIACANVAGVLLARAAARRREIAVRLAMGAGRGRLVRQLLTETMMLFVLGGSAGLLLARVMTTLLVSLLPTLPLPVDVSLPLDARVVGFTTVLSLLAAMLSGLAPALHASRAEVVSALKDDAEAASGRPWMRRAFVVGQVALSIVLVVGAALFVRTLQKGSTIDLGFDPHGVELTSIDMALAGYAGTSGKIFADELVERVHQLPGVERATIASTSDPIGDGRRRGLLTVPGAVPANGQSSLDADWNAIGPGYFATLRIPLVAGRDFSAADRDGAQQVAILGEATAARFFPGQSSEGAIGRFVVLRPGQASMLRDRINRGRGDSEWRLLVVGVARDVKYFGPRDAGPHLFVYIPLQQQPFGSRLTIVARTIHGQRLAAEIRALVGAMNPNLPIVTSQTLQDRTALGLLPQRVAASVSGTLGMVGLLLAAIGIHGVTAYAVARRTREFGVRIALGATRADIVGMVLRQGMSLAGIGSVIGLLLAAVAGRLLASFLLGVTPIDPVAFTGAALLFAAIGLAACYVPARRATRIDPMEALRYE